MGEPCKVDPIIIIHGGAWAIPEKLSEASKRGVKSAALKAYQILEHGGTALDAVEAAIILLEDDPAFDAGKGSCLNSEGRVEMDASIMDGTSLKAGKIFNNRYLTCQCHYEVLLSINLGAIAAVQNIQNPISLARLVMEKTEHCLLVGDGANRFAEELNIPLVETSSLVTDACLEEWKTFQQYKTAVDSLFNNQ